MDKTNKNMAPTAYEVAKLANVSPSTVSRYFNRTSYVSNDKTAKIEEAIRALGYKPHIHVGRFEKTRSMTIGVLVQNPDSPYTSSLLIDMEKVLAEHGYSLLISVNSWQATLISYSLDYLLKSNVDAVIIISGNVDKKLIQKCSEKIPVVAVGYNIEGERIKSISLDNTMGGYLATLHLIQLGHVNIAHIKGLADHDDAISRFEGYKKALDEAGIGFKDKLVVEGDFSIKTGYEKMVELIESKVYFSAVFAANDLTAYGVIRALNEYGFKVPDDVSVIGFDDLPISPYFTPSLTTLRQPLDELGAISARCILKLLSGETEVVRLPPISLITRDSTKSRYQ
ncbi:LacI family DNA-binding transcriptional regulator [Vibrio gazogenes]|uniref:Transcriptional regulator, LacI family n=1 Tax=Vibrio gazogenes DSM 21264 = NBRC 103151 TaxID=1123492 RepID=A0A1M4VHC2_VIBGA|nr:substrate-binding domain-containing protein [Vibrio gazogenes]USP15541.1 substrate-binding domain-containing protein [Vibrio gazogenes]SHE68282.1 transcriptional regulator, LacI family [Vibrio gazogenes DSM 21264] [Vibrio gazogenes DSM 21264 = NBRC 103151]SJN58566.1 Ribose operon repressor [Vibrio gazogenes]